MKCAIEENLKLLVRFRLCFGSRNESASANNRNGRFLFVSHTLSNFMIFERLLENYRHCCFGETVYEEL
jgi:hypothetical protein